MQIEYSSDQTTDFLKNPPKPSKKLEISNFLSKGTYIDSKDSMNSWCVATINEIFLKDDKVLIRYDGWSDRWNDVHLFTSKKLMPFRRHTLGYTGQGNAAIRSYVFKLSELQENKILIERIMNDNFEGLSCFHVTQILRGKLFFYVDNLLSYDYEDPEKNDIIKICEFLFLYIQFSCKYLEKFQILYPQYSKSILNPEAFLIENDVALACCLYEIIESLLYIFNGNKRCQSFYTRNQRLLEEIHHDFNISNKYTMDIKPVEKEHNDGNMSLEEPKDENDNIPKIFLKFISYFGQCGGFNILLQHISLKPSESVQIPYQCLELILKLLKTLMPYLNKELQTEISSCIKSEISKRFSLLSEKEIKDIDKEFLMKLLSDCKSLLENFLDVQTVFEMIENIELDLAYKFLVSPYFEKRLKGIIALSEIAERIEFTEKYGRNNESFFINMTKVVVCKYLNSEIFLNWIKGQKIIDILLGDSIHIEILKRAHELLKFICKRKFLINEIINQVWIACEGKHDSIIRCLYEIIIVISSNMNKESLSLLYRKIKEINIHSYNELSLNLLKEFCENVINLNENSMKSLEKVEISEEFIEEHYFGVNILWKLLLDSSSLNSQLTEEVLSHFKNVIMNPNCKILRKFYLTKSVKEIENGSSIPQSLFIIMKIMQTNYARKSDNENQMKSILLSYDREYHLITLIITDLYRYFNKIRLSFADKIKKSPAFFDEIFEGKHSHKTNLDLRLNLLDMFASYSLLTEENLEHLWDIFVSSALHYQDSVLYFQWLARQNDNAKGDIHIILPKQLLLYQFNNILCDPVKNNFKLMREESFNLFYLFFVTVNIQERVVRMSKNGKLSVINSNMSGINVLWQIFNDCENEKVIEKTSEVLSEIHLRISTEDPLKKRDTAEKFTTYVMSLLKEAYNQNKKLMINKAIYLLIVFFEKFEGKFFKSSGKISNNYYHFLNTTVILKPENVQKEIRINIHDQIGNFRKKISDEFGIPLNQFRLLHKNESVGDSDDDEMTLREFGLGGIYFICRKKNENEENYHPKHLISESQEYLDLLFKLLSEANSECLNNIWNLLMKLPSNEKIKKSLVNMEKSWEELIEIKSFYKCLYCLQIIEELTFANNNEEKTIEKTNFWKENIEEYFENEWHMIFISSQGLEFLISLFIGQTNINFQTHLSKRYLSVLLKLIFFYQKRVNLNGIFKDDPFILNKICTKLLETIHQICEYTLTREQGNLENCYNEKENYLKNNNYIQNSQGQMRRDLSKIPLFFVEEADILFYCQEFLLSIINCSFDLLDVIYSYSDLEKILVSGLILSDNFLLKEKFSNGLSDLFKAYSVSDVLIKPHQFFIPIFMNNIIDIAFKHEERSEMFFNLLITTLDEIPITNEILIFIDRLPQNFNFQIDFYALMQKLVLLIKLHKLSPEENPEKDILLTCSLNLMKVLLNYLTEQTEEIGINLGLIDELLFNCLFIIKNGLNSNHSNYKCKGFNSRMAAFNLLHVLAIKHPRNLQKILDFFIPLLKNSEWRTKSNSDWNITPKVNEKSITGYVGLKNLGCICYMNSLMQQLYMIPSFRNFILEIEDKGFDPTTKEDNVIYQLKCMFLSLKESEKQFYNPRYFCNAFKDWEGNPTNVYEQRDVDEFFNMFMDKLETITKGTFHENYIKNTFGGYVSNEFICKDCPHYSEREEPFLSVSLQVKNKKTLEESLTSFIEGEILEGQNAYLCEQCNKKVTAIKRICLKKLPNHLIIVLKRFEFDYDNMSKVKINDSCEFPMKINMEKYTQHGLRKKEKSLEEENGEIFPEGYFEYELKGLVIHLGNADSGHYYSLIQDREKPEEVKWYEFNDTFVRYFDPRDIPNEAFGGEEKWSYYMNTNMANLKEKIKNAYLLFYDRVVSIKDPCSKAPKEDSKENEDFDKKLPNSAQIQEKIENTKDFNPLEEFHLELIENNFKFHIHRNIFAQEFFRFVIGLVMEREYQKNRDYLNMPFVYDSIKDEKKYYDLELLKLAIFFLLTCVIRDKERNSIIKFLPFLTNQLKKNLPLCLWMIKGMTNKAILEEFFLLCPIQDMRKFVTGLVRIACAKIWKFEPPILKQCDPSGNTPSILMNFINLCINLISELKTRLYDATEFFKLFDHFSLISHELAIYLIHNDVITQFLIYFNHSTETRIELPKYVIKLLKFNDNGEFLLGQPKEIQKKIMTKLDEIKQKRKEKYWLDNNNTNRLYMWRTISHLILYYRVNKAVDRCTKQIGSYDCELSNIDKILIIGDVENIFNILNDANYKISVSAISNIFAYLSWENMKISEQALKAALKGFRERDVNSFRPFFGIIKKLVQIKDSFCELRIEKILTAFLKFMNDNNKFYQDIFYQQQFILKLAAKEQVVRNICEKNPELISWMINWINDYELAHLNSNSVIKSNALKFNRFRIAKSYQEARIFCQEKIMKIKKLMKGELEPIVDNYDSDEDFLDHQFMPGDKIDIYHANLNSWITGKIEKTLNELINVYLYVGDSKGASGGLWKGKDSDDLAPYLSMQEKNNDNIAQGSGGGGPIEIETRDSTEKNAGSNEESENEQPLLRNANSLNSEQEGQGDLLNTTNEI